MAEALGLGFGTWSPPSRGCHPGTGGGEARLPHWAANGRPTEANLAVRAAVAGVAAELAATPAPVGPARVPHRARPPRWCPSRRRRPRR
ncbi:hypothetical protein GCM10023214_75170 [Amycolatopsis dongchuanensis]|uniref:Uncharacterized protein n=1 Tax=Amycolatopsis dongchuanensis TaxID=1070866 RepID=A0ABP8VT27_9PSEU